MRDLPSGTRSASLSATHTGGQGSAFFDDLRRVRHRPRLQQLLLDAELSSITQ